MRVSQHPLLSVERLRQQRFGLFIGSNTSALRVSWKTVTRSAPNAATRGFTASWSVWL
jgi:hypothetical protein